MKMIVWKAPGFLSPILRKLFSGNRRKKQTKT